MKLSIAILGFHLLICLMLTFGWIFNNKIWLEFLILLNVLIQINYFILNGCILTKLDWYLNDDHLRNKTTIVDPIIKLIHLKNKLSNRSYISGLFVNAGLLNTFIMRIML